MRSVAGGPDGANHSVMCSDGENLSYCACGTGVLRSAMSSSVVWCLVPASIDINLRSFGEYIAPSPLNAILMAAWVS